MMKKNSADRVYGLVSMLTIQLGSSLKISGASPTMLVPSFKNKPAAGTAAIDTQSHKYAISYSFSILFWDRPIF